MKICPKCNLTYNDEYSFCKRCGVALEDNQKNMQPVMPTGSVKGSSSNNLLIALIVVFVLILGSVGLYYFHGKMQALENQIQKQTHCRHHKQHHKKAGDGVIHRSAFNFMRITCYRKGSNRSGIFFHFFEF